MDQAWTNLIDNAIDAMKGQGELRIHTCAADNHGVIEMCDLGRHPAGSLAMHLRTVLHQQGAGTGLALHVSCNFGQKHRDRIKVQSKLGNMCFLVTLPIRIR